MVRIAADVKVQLLIFDGCPLADAARANLQEALAACGMAGYELVNVSAPGVPDDLRGWGSPTILIDGREITGQEPGDGLACRVYSTPTQVPDTELIASRLRAAVANGRA